MYLQAVWFTENKGIEGPVFGSNDYWKGLGVFFDSFDNDGQVNKQVIYNTMYWNFKPDWCLI